MGFLSQNRDFQQKHGISQPKPGFSAKTVVFSKTLGLAKGIPGLVNSTVRLGMSVTAVYTPTMVF